MKYAKGNSSWLMFHCSSDLLVPIDIQAVCAVCKYASGGILRAASAIFVAEYMGHQRVVTPVFFPNLFR
jgi:hypothetical protein